MKYSSNISTIEDLALSEGGVFTTAQAARLDIPRDALAYAARSGRIERVAQGAYRLTATEDDGYDLLRALWKLTVPGKFTYERMRHDEWDGITVCGPTASAILDIGDLYASPYYIAAPHRINSRKKDVFYVRRAIGRDDVTWVEGLPVTRPEMTVATLVWLKEDPSLTADALFDALRRYGTTGFELRRLEELLGGRTYGRLLADASVGPGGTWEIVPLDSVGHFALRERDAR